MLEVHQAQVAVDRNRRPPDRAEEALHEGGQEARVAQEPIDGLELGAHELDLLREHLLPQGGLPIVQSQHPDSPRSRMDKGTLGLMSDGGATRFSGGSI